MIDYLIKRLIKNPEKTSDEKVRMQYGKFASITGMIANVLLFAGKLFVGLLSNSIAIISDSVNNLSDAATQFINLFGFIMSGKPADKDHPFGHGRTEYISGLIMSFLVIAIGVEFMRSSFDRILHPEPLSFSPVMVAILLGSIAVKGWLFYFYRKIGKKINAQSLFVASIDSLSDIAITFVTFVSLMISYIFHITVDGYVGMAVSFVVLYAGYKVAKDALTPLLGRSPDIETVAEISRKLKENANILGVHDVIVHDYGPGRLLASAHVEVSSSDNFLEIHDTVDLLEKMIATDMGIPITLHMDPIDYDDPQTIKYRDRVTEILSGIDAKLSVHDFRVVYGKTHTNLIFDVSVPADIKLTDAEISTKIENELTNESAEQLFLVVQYDRFYL